MTMMMMYATYTIVYTAATETRWYRTADGPFKSTRYMADAATSIEEACAFRDAGYRSLGRRQFQWIGMEGRIITIPDRSRPALLKVTDSGIVSLSVFMA